VLSEEDIEPIIGTYHNWRNVDGDYEDVKEFYNSSSIDQVREFVTPGHYVGLPIKWMILISRGGLLR